MLFSDTYLVLSASTSPTVSLQKSVSWTNQLQWVLLPRIWNHKRIKELVIVFKSTGSLKELFISVDSTMSIEKSFVIVPVTVVNNYENVAMSSDYIFIKFALTHASFPTHPNYRNWWEYTKNTINLTYIYWVLYCSW